MIRSVGAVLAGLVVNVVLTVLTDLAMSHAGILPPFGTGFSAPRLVAIALAYRLLYAGVGGYVAARLAEPSRRRATVHWLIGVGAAIGIASTIGGWKMFPHWYLLAIVVGSIATTYLGARIMRGASTPRARAND